GHRWRGLYVNATIRESVKILPVRINYRAGDGGALRHWQYSRCHARRDTADAAARGVALYDGAATERALRESDTRRRNDPATRLRYRAGGDHALPSRRPLAFRGTQTRARSQRRRGMSVSSSVLLAATSIGKRFGGVQALTDVSFSIERGEIYGLIGPNGAGKTSLFNVLTGI